MNSDPEKVRQLVLPLWLAAAALAGWLAGSANAPGACPQDSQKSCHCVPPAFAARAQSAILKALSKMPNVSRSSMLNSSCESILPTMATRTDGDASGAADEHGDVPDDAFQMRDG